LALLLGARGCRPVRRPREDPSSASGIAGGSFVVRLSHRDDVGFPNLEMRRRLRRCGELGQAQGKGVHGIVRGSEGLAEAVRESRRLLSEPPRSNPGSSGRTAPCGCATPRADRSLAQGFMNLLRLPELFLGVPPSPVGQPRDGPLGRIKDVGEFRGRRRGAGALDRLDALRRIIQLGLEVAVPRLQFGGLDPPLVELGGEPPRPRPWPPSIPSTP